MMFYSGTGVFSRKNTTEKAVKSEKSGFSISPQMLPNNCRMQSGSRRRPQGDVDDFTASSVTLIWWWEPRLPSELYAEGSDKEFTSELFTLNTKYLKHEVTEVKLCQPVKLVILPHLKLPYFLYWWE